MIVVWQQRHTNQTRFLPYFNLSLSLSDFLRKKMLSCLIDKLLLMSKYNALKKIEVLLHLILQKAR
jgi:hypothetical protein